MQKEYVAVAEGLKSRRLVPVNENILKIVKDNPKQDIYTSLYTYQDKHLEQFKKIKSLAGITDVKTNRLFFDFDDALSPGNAQADTVETCKRLLEYGVPENSIRIYFSGKKGFHIDCPITEGLTRQEFVNIVGNIAGNLKTFDTKINDEARVLRVPFSIHPDSGLYKIPLSLDEISTLTIEAIREYAKSIQEYGDLNEYVGATSTDLPEQLTIYKTQTYKKVGSVQISDIKGFNNNDLDLSQCPSWMPKERYALQEGFFYGSGSQAQGERSDSFLILAATYKKQGFSYEHALSLLQATAEKQAKRTEEDIFPFDELEGKVSSVYSPGWQGGIYSKDEPILVATRQRFGIEEKEIVSDLVDINNVGGEFKAFAKNIDKNTVKTGLASLDEKVIITSGMMVALLAAPGAGKTSFANMFVEHLSKAGENTIYFSLDMYKNLLFTRLLQKYSGYPMKEIFDQFKNDDADKKLSDAYALVVENYTNTYFNFRSGPMVEEIDQEIYKYKETSGRSPKLIVVDYLEKVRGPFTDATANSGYVASRLSDIAKKHDLVVLLLVQPQKAAGDPREDLQSYRRIKGASVIEQDSRVILTMSRPGYNPSNMDKDKFACISVVKNNMGGLCQLDYRWDGVSGSLSELEHGDKQELKELRESNATAKLIGDDITASGYNKKF